MSSSDIMNIKPFFKKHESIITRESFASKLTYLQAGMDSYKFARHLQMINYRTPKADLAESISKFLLILDFLQLDPLIQEETILLSRTWVKLEKLLTQRPKSNKGFAKPTLLSSEQKTLLSNYFKRQKDKVLKHASDKSQVPLAQKLIVPDRLHYFTTTAFRWNKLYIISHFTDSAPSSPIASPIEPTTSDSIIAKKPRLQAQKVSIMTPRSVTVPVKPFRSGFLPVIRESSHVHMSV